MRSDRYIEEDKRKEDLKDKITATVLGAAMIVIPAVAVYEFEEYKINTMRTYYETLLEETNKESYLQGFIDGMLGIDDNFYIYTDSKGEGMIETITSEIEPEKKLVLTKKIINE